MGKVGRVRGHYLGFVADISPYIAVKQIKLNKNDIILTCTNGLIESHSLRGEQYGKDRIQHNMVSNAMYPARRMAKFVYDDLSKFMSHEMEDDVSILVMKCL
ncbi:MAG: SpoIIE family protein phosphatase [Treponema sp.]